MKRAITPLLGLSIFLLNVWLCVPLFMPGELPFRGSIEGGYVGMARFISEHPNPWGWNPLAYCGLPTQFMYVPGLPYVAAFFLWLLPHASPQMVYRTIVALATCAGPVAVFVFAIYFTGSRRWAFAVAVAYTLLSPSYGLFPAIEKDRGLVQLPWRIQVLAKYGEGPHTAGLALLPLALLALWRAAKGRRVLPAAVLLAAIPLTNWLAAMALAIAAALLLLAAWGEPGFSAWRAVAAAALAYLLACFWLTPGFVRTVASNWPADSFAYQLGRPQVWLLAGAAGGALLIRLAFRFLRGSFYLCFVTLGAFVFGWIATMFYMYGLDTIPESRRYAIEFELFLALALAEGFRLAMRHRNDTVRLSAMGTGAVMLLAGVPQLWAYATQGWHRWTPSPPQQTIEYEIGRELSDLPLQGRIFATGGLRFRLNSWFEMPQVGGPFETGLQNRIPVDLAYRIRTGEHLRPGREAEDTVTLLRVLGAQYVVIHGPQSREYYRDFMRPERVSGTLKPVFRTEDDAILALPDQSLAHNILVNEVPGAAAPRTPTAMSDYVAAIGDRSRPQLLVKWLDGSRVSVSGTVPPGDVVSLQVNADPGWHATQNGREIPLAADGFGFLVVHALPAAQTTIELDYRGTRQQRVFAALSVAAWLVALFWTIGVAHRKNRKASAAHSYVLTSGS